MDWASRAVLSWRLSNTIDTSFSISVQQEELALFGRPEIFNTNQGSQFTRPRRQGRGSVCTVIEDSRRLTGTNPID